MKVAITSRPTMVTVSGRCRVQSRSKGSNNSTATLWLISNFPASNGLLLTRKVWKIWQMSAAQGQSWEKSVETGEKSVGSWSARQMWSKRVAQVNIPQRMCVSIVLVLCGERLHLSLLWNFRDAWLCVVKLRALIAARALILRKHLERSFFETLHFRQHSTQTSNTLSQWLDHFSRFNLFLKNSFLRLYHSQQEKGNARRESTTSPSGMDDSNYYSIAPSFSDRESEREFLGCVRRNLSQFFSVWLVAVGGNLHSGSLVHDACS